jgi:hypothetical protein
MEPLRPLYGAGGNVLFMKEELRRSQLAWEPAAAFACFVASVLSLIGGFVFTTGWILDFAIHPILHGLGLTLLIIGIPLLILGAHFLDLRERKIKKSNLLVLIFFLSLFPINARAQTTEKNQPFFLTEQPGVLKKEQNTATLGLVWWFGEKKGAW